jgi:serpin B
MRKKGFFYYASACLFMLCLTACNNDDDGIVRYMLPETRTINLTESQKEMIKSNNEFSFNLLRSAYSQQQTEDGMGKSIFLSPVSATYMLGMLADGASGETLREINDALGFSGVDAVQVNELCQTLIEEAPKTDKNVKLEIANAIYSNKDYSLAEQFKADMKTYYKADAKTLDFANTNSLNTINNWARQKTHGKIPQVLNEMDPNAVAYLLSSIYFQATWTEQFDKEMTKEETFVCEDGDIKLLQMMNNKSLIPLYENEDCRMVCLPYGSGKAWNMFVLLPKGSATVGELLEGMDSSYWNCLLRTRKNMVLDLKLPKFITSNILDLTKIFPNMDIKRIFGEDAELDGICQGLKLHVSKMVQSGSIEVNEEGTKATAVTVAELMDSAAGPNGENQFYADRPFVYMICENSTNAIFFAGVYQGD